MASVRIQRTPSDTGGPLQEAVLWEAPGLGIWHPGSGSTSGHLDNVATSSPNTGDPTINTVRAYVINTTNNEQHAVVEFYAGRFGLNGTYFPTLNKKSVAATIPPGAPVPVSYDWPAPTAAELAAPNVHVCLVANCYTAVDGQVQDGAPQSTPPAWNVAGNPHHAQRNLTWISSAKKKLYVGNQGRKKQAYVIDVIEDVSPRLHPAQRELIATDPAFRALRKHFGELPHLAREPDAGVVIQARGAGEGSKLELEIAPRHDQIVTLAFEPTGGDRPILRRFTLTQRDLDGQVIDGATVLAVDLPESARELHPRLTGDEPVATAS